MLYVKLHANGFMIYPPYPMTKSPSVEKRIILDLCGGTGSWSQPYKEAGYDVRVITLPAHDIRLFQTPTISIYGVLAAPPCTMFSYARTKAKKPRDLWEGMEIVQACLRIIWELQYKPVSDTAKYTKLKFWALENPNGLLKHFLGKPAFEFNPYDFGDQYQKHTHLWGWFNKPVKKPVELDARLKKLHLTNSQPLPKFDRLKTKEIHGEFYGKYDRQTRRAITPAGFAKAFMEANP